MRDGDVLPIELPPAVARVLAGLMAARDAGGAQPDVALVGGCVRDLVRGERPKDWDVATSLVPELVAATFPGSSWENPYGTVTIRDPGGGRGNDEPAIEVTTFRVEGEYRDRRRPSEVRWGRTLEEDLGRRDFTINAMAWRPPSPPASAGTLVDPFGGAEDLTTGVLRAVGDPATRLEEDALRLLRAVRFATRFDLRLDPATELAIRAAAGSAAGLSGERVRDELLGMVHLEREPSRAIRLMEELGLLAVVLPEVAALRGIPQAKALPGDALDHSLRTLDALPADDRRLRLAGLLHDIGKATTLADGHFIGHEIAGAEMAVAVAERLRLPAADARHIERLVRHHMFAYTPDWTDAAVRRFVRRVGVDLLPDLFLLRRADNAASGAREPVEGGLAELRDRVDRVLAGDPLQPADLAVDGHLLQAELALAPGPALGALLDRLMEAVLDDPSLNDRQQLLALARTWASETPDP